jgi:hypothetical protein
MEAIFYQAIGPGLPKITKFLSPSLVQLDYRAKISSLGPARLHVLARWAGPLSGRAAHAQV